MSASVTLAHKRVSGSNTFRLFSFSRKTLVGNYRVQFITEQTGWERTFGQSFENFLCMNHFSLY